MYKIIPFFFNSLPKQLLYNKQPLLLAINNPLWVHFPAPQKNIEIYKQNKLVTNNCR